MIYDISKFEELVKEGYLRKSEKDDLVLYGYTDKCTFDRHWNEYTRIARGLVLQKSTGELIAKPFPKFFNLGEMEETFLINLPSESYTVHEKVDGSLGIIFFHNGEWQIATRGSFFSEQAVKGKELLKMYDFEFIPKTTTVLAEIIYPENKIIVNYGKDEKLVMLGAFNRETEFEYSSYDLWSISMLSGIPRASEYNYTIEQMIELQKTMPKDQEGFVIRFNNDLRVKIKGHEYLRIAKILSHMSPISFWEVMEDGKVNRTYLEQLPEEFKKDFEPIVETLEKQYSKIFDEVIDDVKRLPTNKITPEDKRTIGLFLKEANLKHSKAIFPYVLGSKENLINYIMSYIRPDGNNLKEF